MAPSVKIAAVSGGTPAFRLMAGTYERLLYGLDAQWKNETDPSDKSIDFSLVIAYATHIGCVKAIAVGGNLLASGSTDEVIKLYDLKKRKELGSLHSHEGTINQLSFYGSSHLLSAADDGSIAIYRTKDWEHLKSLRGHKGSVIDLALHPSGKLAISIGRDMTLRMWDLLKGRCAFISRLHHSQDHYEPGLSKKFKPSPEKLRWSPVGDRYAVLYADGIDVFSMASTASAASATVDYKDKTAVLRIQTTTARQRINCMTFYSAAPTALHLLVGHEDGCVRGWQCEAEQIASGKPLFTLKAYSDGRVKDLSVVQTGRGPILLTISSSGVARAWDLERLFNDADSVISNGEDQQQQQQQHRHKCLIGEHDTKGSRLTCMAIQMTDGSTATATVEDELFYDDQCCSDINDGSESSEGEKDDRSDKDSSTPPQPPSAAAKEKRKFSMRLPVKGKHKRNRNQ